MPAGGLSTQDESGAVVVAVDPCAGLCAAVRRFHSTAVTWTDAPACTPVHDQAGTC